jgi:Uma2 family endonuclease
MSETVATTARRWTISDLEGLPEDGNQYEIIDGELLVTTAPHLWHQVVVGRVYKALADWSDSTGAGLAIPGPGVIISPADAVIPDVVWISQEHFWRIAGEDGKLHGAPDLVVEVLSQGAANEERDRATKRENYGAWGVQEYWIVNPFARMVEVYRPADGVLRLVVTLSAEDVLTSSLLPAFSAPVEALFVGLPNF